MLKRFLILFAVLAIGAAASPAPTDDKTPADPVNKTETDPDEPKSEANVPDQPGVTTWLTDYDEAIALSEKRKRPVLLLFSADEWSKFSQLQDEQIFKSEAFLEWAESRVVRVRIDRPEDDEKFDEADRKLAEKLKIDGYPTVIYLDSAGKELGRQAGFVPNRGVEKWIATARQHTTKYGKKVDNKGVIEEKADGWHTSYEAALAEAKETGKPILIDFNGSDW